MLQGYCNLERRGSFGIFTFILQPHIIFVWIDIKGLVPYIYLIRCDRLLGLRLTQDGGL